VLLKRKLIKEKEKIKDLYRTYTYRPLIKEVINPVIKRLLIIKTLLESSLN